MPVCCVCVCVLQSVYVCVCCGACLQVFQKLASKFHYTRAFTQMKPQRRLTSSVELPTAVLARSQSHHSTAQHSTAQHKSIHKNCYHTNPSPLQCSSSRRCYQCRRHTSTHTQTTTPFPHLLNGAAHGAVTNVGVDLGQEVATCTTQSKHTHALLVKGSFVSRQVRTKADY